MSGRRGPGRPSVNAPHRVQVRLTDEQLQKLDAYCQAWEVKHPTTKARALPRAEAIRQLIEQAEV